MSMFPIDLKNGWKKANAGQRVAFIVGLPIMIPMMILAALVWGLIIGFYWLTENFFEVLGP